MTSTIKFFLAVLILMLSGCTAALWNPDYRTEYVSGFYVNIESRELLVSTRDTGYIFPADDDLIESMLLSRRVQFEPEFRAFQIDRNNSVSGILILHHSGRVEDPLESELENIGFYRNSRGMQLHKKLVGKRYTIVGDLPLVKLEKEYPVQVTYLDSYTEVAGKIVATPATITYDAIVYVPASLWILGVVSYALMEGEQGPAAQQESYEEKNPGFLRSQGAPPR
jgi:hypothetical protein